MTEKAKIIAQASILFMRYGIKSVSMDDLARELGISKKTIYQHFESKTNLVNVAFSEHLTEMEELIQEYIKQDNQNAIEQILGLAEMHQNLLHQMKPTVLFDVEKYYKSAWLLIQEHKDSFVQKIIEDNLIKGMKEGLYRLELDVKILSILYKNQITLITDITQFPYTKFDLSEVHKSFINFYIHGIASEKGRSFLKKLNKYEENESELV